MVLVFMILLQISLQVLVAPPVWMYLSETLNDSQFGIIATLHYSNGALIATTVEFVSKALKPEGLFALFGFIGLFSSLFKMIFFKETAHLTDKQKKELYFPKSYRNQQ